MKSGVPAFIQGAAFVLMDVFTEDGLILTEAKAAQAFPGAVRRFGLPFPGGLFGEQALPYAGADVPIGLNKTCREQGK